MLLKIKCRKLLEQSFKQFNFTFKSSRYRYSQSKWESVIGLEVHAQINTDSKLFSGASTLFSNPINTNVSLFDSAIPGTLPVLNKKCIEAGVLTALALNCTINPISMFDRKHYFYADIPAGYQITQQRAPLATNGYMKFEVFAPGIHKHPYETTSKIKQIQLEQDSGRSIHDQDRSLIDLNRAGTPLMELVFEPDLKDGEEAAALVKELTLILQRLNTCSCKMEEGALRVDANVSVHKLNEPLGVRTEIKNIGSVRGVATAVKYEIDRQINLLENGLSIINETRAWDALSKKTVAMRDKEQQQDYRYMPEPNLPPLYLSFDKIETTKRIGCVNVDVLRKTIPELPEETRRRLKNKCGLSAQQALILVNEPVLLRLFEASINSEQNILKIVANLLINDLLTFVNKEKVSLETLALSGNDLSEIACLVRDNTISRNVSKLVLNEILSGKKNSPRQIVEDNDWLQINNENEIKKICNTVIEENANMLKQYKGGKTKVYRAFLGAIWNKSNQKANMSIVDGILKKLLDEK